MKAYTSRSRFDERRNFTGVFQQMGRVSLDADWNEEVLIRTTDARRRSADLAQGSPDDGFLISDEHLLDRIDGSAGWSGNGLAADDQRVIPAFITLDRREPEGLPHVIRCQGHRRVRRTLHGLLDLGAIPLTPAGSFAAHELIVSVRFERPANDDDPTAVAFFVQDADGATATVAAGFGAVLPESWFHQRIPVTDLAGVDTSRIAAWGVAGLSPRATTWIDALRASDTALRHDAGPDLVIRGGDGSVAGAGRMLLDGVRTYLERDVRYGRQPDLPDPPVLAELPTDGSLAHLVYLDVWEQLITALDDRFLHEPALEGPDTTVRLQLLRQVKVLQQQPAAAPPALPTATGGGRLTTNLAPGLLPDRYPAPPADPCRDRCLFTESASTGEGYTGAHNLHLRIEVLDPDAPAFVWSRDNGSTRIALDADAPAGATSLSVAGEEALLLRAGDLIVVSDRRIDRQPEGPRPPLLRAIKAVDPGSGILYLEDPGFTLTDAPAPLPAGGPIEHGFALADRAYVRRWDGADLLLTDVRYNLPDNINFRFAGSGWRRGDYWSMTARVENADGAARGVLEQLSDAPVHGPVHRYVPLSRVTRGAAGYRYQDLRPRFLPLAEVRDRLAELAAAPDARAAFTLVIGDGERTFGDIDQDLTEGVTGDEALQSAVQKLCATGGGSIYLRAGSYRLEKPVQLSGCSRLRILGDGDASELRAVGAGGAFILDGCGSAGGVTIEQLALVERPREQVGFGDAPAIPLPETLPPLIVPVAPLEAADLLVPGGNAATFMDTLVASLSGAQALTNRTFNSVLATLQRLREIQRANPGQPLEQIPEAQPLMERLQRLPHGLVTVSDSSEVTLRELSIESRGVAAEAGGIFLTGSCDAVRVSGCRILAPAGILAAPYGPYLSRSFFAHNPRSGLYLTDLTLEANRLTGSGDATTGISLTGATLRGLRIADNRIDRFNVGIAVGDRSDLDRAGLTGGEIARNRLLNCDGLGIDLEGRGLDLADNRVEGGTPAGLFQAGIRVQGSGIRLRGCQVDLRGAAIGPLAGSPLALRAAIVVGAGADAGDETGFRGPGPVQNVEIAGCRIGGAGRLSPVIGVLVGGPQPTLDVRVRDCSFSDLGDAAVRVWGHGGRSGRIRVDDNRIERVALAAIPANGDTGPAIEALAPSVVAELRAADVSIGDPAALLGALVASQSSAVTGPLDAVLRWVSLRTLRGAVVFDQVEDGEIVTNRIDGVGADDATRGDGVRTSAIAAVGATDLVVEGNRIEHVSAERRTLEEPAQPPGTARPPLFDLLAGLDLGGTDDRVERLDVHGAATALRRLILDYGKGSDPLRMRLGRRIYGAMDALVEDLDAFGGRGAKIAAGLVNEADTMRTAQGRDDHTIASDRVRATLSRAAAFTAGDDAAQTAWEAAAQFDLAVVDGNVKATAQRLQDSAAQLAEGLPPAHQMQQTIEEAMGQVLGRLETLAAADDAQKAAARQALEAAQFTAATVLGTLGELRDAEHLNSTAPKPGSVFGSRQTIIQRFAERIDTEAARLATDADAQNRTILDGLRADTEALVENVAGANAGLARTLEADWNALERSVTDEKRTRLLSTLTQVKDWSAGGGAPTGETDLTADLQRQADAGNAALIGMVAGHIDNGIGKLLVEPEGVKTKNLKVLQGAGGQLQNLVGDDPHSADLASKATAAIRTATADPQKRSAELAKARVYLGDIKRLAGGLTLRPPVPPVSRPAPIDPERRLAALGALVLSVTALEGGLRDEGLALLRDHFERLIDAAGFEGRNRSSALTTIGDAATALGRTATSGHPAARYAAMKELDRVATATSSQSPPAGLAATAVLIRGATLALDPDEDTAARQLRVQAYLRDRADTLTDSTQQALARLAELDALTGGIRQVLERLAMKERPVPADTAPPFFPQRLAPADGIFAAAPRGRLRVAHNQVQHAVRGATLLGSTGHPLVGSAPAEATGLLLQLTGNRLDGCALGGFELRPDGDACLNLSDNEVFACAGIGEQGPDGIGQSVAVVAGSGELVVQGNLFQGNGHRHPRAVLHELTLDWQGETVVRGNTIRHLGGGAGGAALLVLAEPTPGTLPAQLARAPFLGIEPPPKPAPAKEPQAGIQPPFILPLLQPNLAASRLSAVTPERITSGRLTQRISTSRIAPRLLTRVQPARFTGLAADNAVKYLDRQLVPPLDSMLDFVKLRPYNKPPAPPPPPQQRSFHIEGNDLSAYGPALLLIGEEAGDLISSSIVGNGLHSEGGTGAAYVRHVDSLVFASNRCQSPDTVNVVVIRTLTAAMSITGNLVLGREPVAPPVPVQPPRPVTPIKPGLPTLHLPLGAAGMVSVPLDAAKLRGSIESFSGEARKAFANVLVEQAAVEQATNGTFLSKLELNEVAAPTTEATPTPTPETAPATAPAPTMEAASFTAAPTLTIAPTISMPFSATLSGAQAKYSIAPFEGVQKPETVLKYIEEKPELGSRDVEAILRGTQIEAFADEQSRVAFTNQLDGIRLEKKAKELETKSSTDKAIQQSEAASVFSRVSADKETEAGAVASMAKLFTAQGFKAERTTAEVQALLEKNEGNAFKALDNLQRNLFASGEARPEARKAIEDMGLLEHILTDELFTGGAAVAEPDEEEPVAEPAAPDPYRHSMVILGGTAVAAVGNSSTAGTLVQDAQESVELNV